MTFDPQAYVAALADQGADVRKFGAALAERVEPSGEFTGSRGWLRGEVGRGAAHLKADRSDYAFGVLKEIGAVRLVERGDTATQKPARWALVIDHGQRAALSGAHHDRY